MGFLTRKKDFDYRPLLNGLVELQRPVIYDDEKCGRIEAPAGFVFNLSSYWLSRPLFDRLGKCQRAAAIHDYLYGEKPEGISRADADRIYRQALAEDGVGRAGRWARWAGLRLGGWYAWMT